MRAFALGLLLIAFTSETRAAAPKFPYDAVAQAEDVEVRSGPGTNYYATGKLGKNAPVTVHRHDPGGWFMISPPPGSFSYIDARFVQRQGERGTVQIPPNDDGSLPRAIVRIGSQLGDDHAYYGRQLTNGDELRILGERTLTTDRGATTMLMVVPPQREYRWVKGDFIIAADASIREQKAADPYADPLVETGVRLPALTVSAEPLAAPDRELRTAATGPSETSLSTAKSKLREVDSQYVDMVAKPPVEWDIAAVEEGYRSVIRALPANDPLIESVENRIRALAERRKIQEEFQDFVRLTSATTQRDAELAAMQATPSVGNVVEGSVIESAPTFDGQFPSELVVNAPNGLPVVTGTPGGPTLPIPTSAISGQPNIVTTQPQPIPGIPQGPSAMAPGSVPAPNSSSYPVENGGIAPQLNGAGIVQRAPARPGSPRYMLIAPNGKFLTFLDAAPGLDLEGSVGQSMGVIGRRYYEPSVRAEMIVVRQMMPVQLQ